MYSFVYRIFPYKGGYIIWSPKSSAPPRRGVLVWGRGNFIWGVLYLGGGSMQCGELKKKMSILKHLCGKRFVEKFGVHKPKDAIKHNSNVLLDCRDDFGTAKEPGGFEPT